MRLNVAYSTDENYVRHLGVSLISLLENNKKFNEIYVYVIESNISIGSKDILKEICMRYERTIIFMNFNDIAKKLNVDDSFNILSYGRLFLGNIKEIDKILYLDCDSIITDSLYNLWKKDISNYYIAAVQDTVNEFYLSSIGLTLENRYVNAGFLLINLKKWREESLEDKFINMINKFKGSVPHHDQGVINSVCKEKILIIDPNYNVQCPMFSFNVEEIKQLDNLNHYYTQSEINNAKKEPKFIHFTNGFFNRPWNKSSTHPLVQTYLSYLNMSPWKGSLLDGTLNRNTKIMKLIYNTLPFSIYKKIYQFINYSKKIKIILIR